MQPTLALLMRQRPFRLRLLAGVPAGSDVLERPLTWAHSSDLEDPTPWLSAGGLLLTDGTQFDAEGEAEWADGYVGRLADCGVAALGFATEVVHARVPRRLVDACERRGLALLEVPDRSPFMAVIAFVAEAAAQAQRERLEWSLSAQRAVARAALRPDGLDAVLAELERQLGCWVALYDAAGHRVRTATRLPVPAELDAEVRDQVEKSLARGTRGAVRISTATSDVTLQTLGQSRRLRGVLAVGAQTRLDEAGVDLVTSVIALASIALDQSRTIEAARQRLRTGLFRLMLAGALEVAGESAEPLAGPLPTAPLRVIALAHPLEGRALTTELDLYADRHPGRLFFAEHQDRLVAVVRDRDLDELQELVVGSGARAGCSSPVPWAELVPGLAEARRAAEHAAPDRPFLTFEELAADGLLGLLEASGGAAVARRILRPLDARPAAERDLLAETVRVWLEQKGAWDPAAKRLGVHRHTLRNRIATVERLLGLDLDRFADRAELWAALRLDG